MQADCSQHFIIVESLFVYEIEKADRVRSELINEENEIICCRFGGCLVGTRCIVDGEQKTM